MADRRVTFLVGANVQNFVKGMNKAQRRFRRFGSRLQRTGRSLTRSLTVPLGLAGGAALKMASDFESSMTRIETLVGLSREQVQGMRSDVLSLAREAGRAPIELSEALFTVTSAGLRGAESMQVLERAAKASAIGLGETREIARATTAVLQAYGKENISAAQATDTLTAIVREGNLQAEELAPVLGRVVGIASQLGISFAEVGASVATFTRLGVSAEEAVTGLRGVMNALLKQTPKAQKALDSIGLTFDDLEASIGEKGLARTLVELVKRFNETGNAQGLSALLGRVRGLAAVLGTAGAQGESYIQILENIQQANGIVNEGFARVSQTTEFKFNKALNNLKTVGIELGSVLLPLATDLLDFANRGITLFSNLSDETIRWGLAIAGAAAAIGPAIFVIGKLVTAISVLLNPITAVIVGVGVLATAIYTNWDEITKFFSDEGPEFMEPVRNALDSIVRFAKTIFERLRSIFKIGVEVLAKAWRLFGTNIFSVWKGVFVTVINLLGAALEGLSVILDIWSARWLSDWEGFLEDTKSSFKDVFGKEGFLENIATSWWERFLQNDPIINAGNWISTVLGLDGPIQKASKEAEKESQETVDSIVDIYKGLSESLSNMSFSIPGLSLGGDESGSERPSRLTDNLIQIGNVSTTVANTVSTNMGKMRRATSDFSTAAEAALQKVKFTWEDFQEFLDRFSDQFKSLVVNQISNSVISFGETVGQTLAGVEGQFKTTFEKIVIIFLDFAKQIAKLAATIGALLLFVPGGQGAGIGLLSGAAAVTAAAAGIEAGINKRAANRRERAQGMAIGGIIPPGFPNDSYPAMLSSGETVIPAPKPLPSGGRRQVIENVVMLDGREVYRNQKEVNNRVNR